MADEHTSMNAAVKATTLNTGYILGMAKIDSGVKILLDIDKVLSAKEIQGLENNI